MKKNISRIILSTIMLSIIVCSFTNVNAQSDEQMKKVLNTLSGYRIIESNTTITDDVLKQPVKRVDMIKLVVKMLGLDDVAKAYNVNNEKKTNLFKDISESDVSNGYIAIAVDMKLINGDSDGNFRPNDNILSEEALKIAVSVLGYTPVILKDNNYPDNYINLAYNLSLLKGVVIEKNKPIKCTDIYTILYNALDISLMQMDYSVKEKYSINTSKTIRGNLESSIKISAYKGVMYGNSDNNFSSGYKLNKDEINIEGIKYYAPNINTDNLIGKTVEFFVDINENNHLPIITQIKEKVDWNKELLIEAKDIIDYKDSTINYYDNKSKKQSIKMSQIYSMTYNGVADFGVKLPEYKKLDATLKFIDNNNDDIYEVLMVTASSDAIVDHIGSDNMMIYFKYTTKINDKSTLSLDSKDNPSQFEYKLVGIDGTEIALENVKENSAISVFYSLDKKKVKIVVNGDTINAVVKEINTSDGKVTINDKEYEIANSNGNYIDLNVVLGKTYLFYINCSNKVFYAYEPQLSDAYAFILAKGKNTSSIDNNIEVKLLMSNKEIKIYKIALPVTIETKNPNGTTQSNVYKTCEAAYPNINTNSVMSYALKAEAGIKTITYAKPIQATTATRIYNDASAKDSDGDLIRTDGTNIFSTTSDTLYATDKNTAIFFAPDVGVPEFTERQYKEKYILKTDKAYVTQAYDFDEKTQLAKAIIVYINPLTEEGFKIVDKTPFAIVSNVISKVDDKGDLIKKIELVSDGKNYSYELASDCYDFAVGDSLIKGDIIQYLIGYDGRFSKIYKHFSLSYIEGLDYFSGTDKSYGKVYDISTNKLVQTSKVYVDKIKLIDNSENIIDQDSYPTNKKNIYKIDLSYKKYVSASFDDAKTTVNNGKGNESYVYIGKNTSGPIFSVIINK